MYAYKNGQGSIILRVKLLDSTKTDGSGLTGLTFASAGLIISTITDVDSAAVVYTQAAGNIETIATNGTFATPTASKCRFKEVDSTNHKGIYEIQIANARYAVSNAKSIIVSLSGAGSLAQTDIHIPLTVQDPYNITSLFQQQMTESYNADGTVPTPEQALMLILQYLTEFNITGANYRVNKLDGVTQAANILLNDASNPTGGTRNA